MPDSVFAHWLAVTDATPDQPVITLWTRRKGIPRGGAEPWLAADTLSWSTLLRGAALSAEQFQRADIGAGTTVAILRHLGRGLLFDFLGAVLAGALPCVVAPPNPRVAPEVFRRKLEGMTSTSGFHAFSMDPGRPELVAAVAGLPESTRTVAWTPGLLGEQAARDRLSRSARIASGDDPLFLQHSSGTSGVPKGVAITHAMLLSQLRSCGTALGVTGRPGGIAPGTGPHPDHIASWLPMYHDMGMVACLWGSLLWNVESDHLSNFDWVLEPLLLSDVVAERRPSLVWLPNFAFSLMARVQGQHGGPTPDVSSVRAWVNCSEPVLAASMDGFCAAFGVPQGNLSASYAMAENVFAVTQSLGSSVRLEADAAALSGHGSYRPVSVGTHGRTLVSSGRVVPGTQVRIVPIGAGPESQLEDGHAGEILIRGDCCFRGYFNRPAESARAFRDGWYATGDLGFLWEEELYVTGRCSDLIICGGRNIDPTEVEALAAGVSGCLPGRACCIGQPDEALGTEEVHLMVETGDTDPAEPLPLSRPALTTALKRAAADANIPLRGVWVLPQSWLIKSTSGKIARRECRGKLERLLALRNAPS